MPSVRSHPGQVVRMAARCRVRHGGADDVDVSQPGIRVTTVEGEKSRPRLEPGIPRGERRPGRVPDQDCLGARLTGAEPDRIRRALPRRAGVEIEPGVEHAFAGVEAVGDQDDHVLLSGLEIRHGARRDVDRELVERDPVGSAIGVGDPGEFPEQGAPPRLGVASGQIAQNADAATANRRRRRSSR